MEKNVGNVDRGIRIAAGLVLIGVAATGTVGWWGWLGVLPLATGLFARCPGYVPFGIKTFNTSDRKGA
jgi:hypothetical protein